MWSDNRTRIRRYLRDPNANIWSDALLLALWNDAQREIVRKAGFLEKAEAVAVPPEYDMAYLHDWEWAFLPEGHGYCHEALHYYQQGEIVLCSPWEAQTIAGTDGSSSDLGPHFTHPWEGFMTPCADPVPLRLPRGFSESVLVAWDRWPMDPLPKKALQTDDPSWKTHAGKPQYYWRDQVTDQIFYLYPFPSAVAWHDTDGTGMVTAVDGVGADLGLLIDIPGALDESDTGITLDVINLENNAFFIFRVEAEDLAAATDESDFPPFLQKYVEFAVLEKAYNADTDGKNDTLRDFWAKRKDLGIEVIKRFLQKRRSDRDFRLVTPSTPGGRNRRQPRLPDTYPRSY